MRSLEIFSGAGGLALGLSKAGMDHVMFLEWNRNACASLRENFAEKPVIETDIRNFDFSLCEGVDIIAGGPPCQPFSLGGKHKGFSDKRDMFPYAIEGIRQLAPKAFVFENVKGLLRQSFASYFNYIILQLTYPEVRKREQEEWPAHLARLEETHTKGNYVGLKYNVVYRLVNAANYGIPQRRERVIIVGIKDSLNVDWSFPQETHSHERLMWDKFVTGEYWDRMKVAKAQRETLSPGGSEAIDRLKERLGMFPPDSKPWVTVREALHGIPDPRTETTFSSDHVYRDGARAYPGHTGSYIDEPSKTIKAGDHGVPGGENMIRFEDGSVRYLTVLEAKRIQTFPDDYVISGAWGEAMRQLGNAVPVRLGEIIGNSLMQRLNTYETAGRMSAVLTN